MGLFENIKITPVTKLTLRDLVLLNEDDTIRDAVNKMREANLGCAVAVDSDRKPRGLFTEAMLRAMLAKTSNILDEPVNEHLSTTFPWVSLTDSVEMVLEAMEAKNIRFVVVLDEAGKVAGLTGQKGLMEFIAEHFPGEVMVQRIGTKHYPEEREGA